MSTETGNTIRGRSVVTRAVDNFAAFLHCGTSGAFVFLATTIADLGIANSALGSPFWHTHDGVFASSFQFDQSIKHWVDDALMGLFFWFPTVEPIKVLRKSPK